MASLNGHIEPTTRLVPDLFLRAGASSAAELWIDEARFHNPIAAVPSLHAAYPALYCAFFWHLLPRSRVPLALYAALMGVSVVYGSEHWVLDVLLGWLYAVVAVVVVGRLWCRAQPQARPTSRRSPDPWTARR